LYCHMVTKSTIYSLDFMCVGDCKWDVSYYARFVAIFTAVHIWLEC